MTIEKKLIENDKPVALASTKTIENCLYENINSKGNKSAFPLPVTTSELTALIERKKAPLSDIYGITVTSKSKNKARDFICRMLLELDGGYQQLKGIWIKEYKAMLESLYAAKSMPDSLCMTFDYEECQWVCINDNADLSATRKKWRIEKNIFQPEENEKVWKFVSGKEKNVISNVYAASQIVVSTHSADMGLGNAEQDLTYIKSQFGINFIGNANVDYHSFSASEDAIVILLTRPSNINESIAYFEKKLKELEYN
jgi:hypothetical protein